MATLSTALDEILTKFKDAWETPSADSDLGGGVYVPIYWPNSDKGIPKDVSSEWVRITTVDLGKGRHAGIGSGTGRYHRTGSMIFQIFTEKGDGVIRGVKLAQIILDAYDGKKTASGVVFTDTYVMSIGPESGGWFQTNVTVFYEFDEFK